MEERRKSQVSTSRKDDNYASRVLATVNFRNSIKHTDGDGRPGAAPCINHYLSSAQDLILHSRRSLYGGVSKRSPGVQGDNWVPGKWGESGGEATKERISEEEEGDWKIGAPTSLTDFEELEEDLGSPLAEAEDDLVMHCRTPSASQSRPRLSIIQSRNASMLTDQMRGERS
ncbi:hypothetical protein BSKO_11131 [Bryopsis sp. KO-2023]|nr:hypothetical protein BSKO_11131 [Bryopsis sp. KO-2023]